MDGDNPLSGNDKDYINLASMRNTSPMLAHPKVVLAPLSPNPPQCRRHAMSGAKAWLKVFLMVAEIGSITTQHQASRNFVVLRRRRCELALTLLRRSCWASGKILRILLIMETVWMPPMSAFRQQDGQEDIAINSILV